jgi:hypothetical protein
VATELPSLDEFQALMNITNFFYYDLLRPLYPEANSFRMEFVDGFLNKNSYPPLILMHFEAVVRLHVIDMNEVPSQEELFEVSLWYSLNVLLNTVSLSLFCVYIQNIFLTPTLLSHSIRPTGVALLL